MTTIRQMKRCKLKILTACGALEVSAYNVGNGVYVHRLAMGNKLSKNSWTISAECGYSLMHFTKPCLLKEVMAKAQELTALDWRTFTEKEWSTLEHDPYQELIYKVKC